MSQHPGRAGALDGLRRLALRLPHQADAVLSAGLLLTVALVAGLGVYIAQAGAQSAQKAQAEVTLNHTYEDARVMLGREIGLERRYRTDTTTAVRADHAAAARGFETALAGIERSGSARDRTLVQELRSQHDAYLSRTEEVFAAVDDGDAARADMLERQLVPLSSNLFLRMSAATDGHERATLNTLRSVLSGANTLAGLMPVAVFAGLVFAMLLVLLLHVNRQARNAKSLFLAKMSHELRTPLNSILGFSQLMAVHGDAALDERQRRYLANIQSSGQQLLDFVNDVLDLSKAEAGSMEMAMERVSLREVAEEAAREMEPLADARGLKLALDHGGSDYQLRADRRRLVQVVLNGLSNAIKFSDPGGEVCMTARPAGGDKVELVIEDCGCGIPEDRLGSAFDEFRQVVHRRADPREGAGLGLPLSRRLVELMGGRLVVESRVGQGTRFRVVMPSAGAEGAPATAGGRQAEAGAR